MKMDIKNNWSDVLVSYGSIIGYIIICIIFSILSPTFITPSNIFTFLSHIAPLALMTFGLAIIMIGGDFDLSFVGVAGFSAVLTIVVTLRLNLVLGLAAGLLLGVIIGFLNGFFVVKVGIHPWLATIATMRMALGLEQVLSRGNYLVLKHPVIRWLGNGQIWVIPIPTILMLAIFFLLYLLMEKYSFGYRLYAVGGNEDAARIAGLKVKLYRILAFILMGGLAFMAGLFLVGTLSGYTPKAAEPLLLDAILAVFIAQTISRRDIINIAGALFGVVFMGTLTNGLALVGVPSYWMQLVKGLLIISVVISKSVRGTKMVQI